MKKLLILLMIVLYSCSNGHLENKIDNKIEGTCKSGTCLINIRELTDFPWDKMYVFDMSVTYDQMVKVLGVKPTEYTEFTRKLVFMLNHQITYFEEDKTDIETAVNGQLDFDIPYGTNYKCYPIDSAKFNVVTETDGDIKYYILKQVK